MYAVSKEKVGEESIGVLEAVQEGVHEESHGDCDCGCSGEGLGCKIKKFIKYGVGIAVVAVAGYFAWKYFKKG